jgi:metallo-beta-lactamase class B
MSALRLTLRRSRWRYLAAAAIAACLPLAAKAQSSKQWREENRPIEPFHLIANVYYVGASDVTSFLFVTSAGDILLDGGFEQTAPQIEANIQKLGFQLRDVKILLNSHAHFDHAGGLAELKRRTGAQFVAMDGDADLLARGGRGDFYFGDSATFPPVKPDRVIHDGETVSLGDTTLIAHLTSGHTRGDTTWTTTVMDGGNAYHVVFVGSVSVLDGYRLAGHISYPGIAEDYERTFQLLKSLPCDVFLGAHGSFFGFSAKRAAMLNGAVVNPFIDPSGYRAFVAQGEANFRAVLLKQQAAAAQVRP